MSTGLAVEEEAVAQDSERDEADRYVLQKVERFIADFKALKEAERIPLADARRTGEIVCASMAVDTAVNNLCASSSQLADLLRERGIDPGVSAL